MVNEFYSSKQESRKIRQFSQGEFSFHQDLRLNVKSLATVGLLDQHKTARDSISSHGKAVKVRFPAHKRVSPVARARLKSQSVGKNYVRLRLFPSATVPVEIRRIHKDCPSPDCQGQSIAQIPEFDGLFTSQRPSPCQSQHRLRIVSRPAPSLKNRPRTGCFKASSLP